jgi:hypothetical protein
MALPPTQQPTNPNPALCRLLLLGDLKHANIVFERFVAKHPSIGTLPDQTLPQSAGLVNFLWHLLPLCQYDAAPVFVTLRRMVKPDDASFSEACCCTSL